MTIQPTFTDRESFIAWRANWRESYAEISSEIRSTRRRIANRFKANQDASQAQNDLRYQRELANRMMIARTEAKALCAAQYAEAKSAKQAA